jgi:hypothetical protein
VIVVCLSVVSVAKCGALHMIMLTYAVCVGAQVSLPPYAHWLDNAENNAALLHTGVRCAGVELPFAVCCTAQECITVRKSPYHAESSIVATVEVSKKVGPQSLRQAEAQFLCASMKSVLPVISVVTDMKRVGIACYTTGQKTADGIAIIIQRVFPSAADVLKFLGAAICSIPPDTLHVDADGHFILPKTLRDPTRRRLPAPDPGPRTVMENVALSDLGGYPRQ